MMHPGQRQDRILAELRVHGELSATDFAEREQISAMTVRRDLSELADRGLLRRVHGGAVAVDTAPSTGIRHRPAPRAKAVPDEERALFTLGLVVPDSGYYFPKIVAGIASRISALGGRVRLGVSHYDAERERQHIERLVASGVDGLLVTPSVADAYATLELLDSLSMPVVVVERNVVEAPVGYALESVRSDHEAGASIALRHLVELGHRRIGLAAFNTPTSPQLFRGHARAVEQLKLEPDAVVELIDPTQRVSEQTRAFLDRCVATGTTAVLVHSDQYAVEFVDSALAAGLSIPGDLSIVAYDDEVASLAAVPLTAVAPPKDDIGRFAATACFERIAVTGQTPFARRHITLTPTLSIRESSGPPGNV